LLKKNSTIREFLRIIGISLQNQNDIIIDEQLPSFPEVKYKLDKCIKEAFNNRLEIKTQEIILAQQKRNIAITKNRNKPNISLNLQSKHLSKEEEEFKQAIKEHPDRSWEVRLIFSYPFFDSNKTKTEIEKANIIYEASLARLKRLKEDIANEIFLIYNELESLKHRLRNLELNLKLSKQTLKMNQMKYKLGKTSSREVMESQLSYRKVKSNYEDVCIGLIMTQLKLLKAMGISLKEYIFSQ
jgi:outer membrane protein TolC